MVQPRKNFAAPKQFGPMNLKSRLKSSNISCALVSIQPNAVVKSFLFILEICSIKKRLGKVSFYWGEWAGASEGSVLSKFFTNWGRSNLFCSQPGEGHSFFGKEKINPCRFYFVYISKATSQDYSKLFTGVEKFIYQKTIFSQLT